MAFLNQDYKWHKSFKTIDCEKVKGDATGYSPTTSELEKKGNTLELSPMQADPKMHVRGPRLINKARTSFTYDVYYIDDDTPVADVITEGTKKAYEEYLDPNYQPDVDDA